jgi:hypothetical protein
MAIEAGLDPLFGVSIRIDVSMMACGMASVGVPPAASKLMGKHLADIIVSAELGITAKIIGRLEQKTLMSQRLVTKSGELNVGFEGYFLVAITARLGSDYIVSVAAVGEARITIANDNEISINAAELSFESEVYLKPMQLKVSIKATALVIFSKSRSKTWKLWKEDKNIWKSNRHVLVDFNKLKAAKAAKAAKRKNAKK